MSGSERISASSAEKRTEQYAAALSRMIRLETVSGRNGDNGRFHAFRELLKKEFPLLFSRGEYREFEEGFVLRWPGKDAGREPVLFMNHHDVVEAAGEWKHDPFSGEIAEGKLWGRGTLDDKGGLWAMLQAGEELLAEGFTPGCDIWFSSSSTEETTGRGAKEIVRWFEDKGIRFRMCFDEGGFIVYEPIRGAKARFAMIGVGEKGCADLKFIARSRGGHASMPARNSPLVRLGRFMAEADRHKIFEAQMSPAVCEMLRGIAPAVGGQTGEIMARAEAFRHVLIPALLRTSPGAAAILRTTLAFTMAQGSGGTNVLPTEAWVVGNMRYSHHQGRDASFEAVRKLAEKYDLEMEVMDPGEPSRITDYRKEGYTLAGKAVKAVFPGVTPVPYLMTGASDARFFDRVSDQCIRFLPFFADDEQLASIHGLNECVNLDSLAPAVDFYRYLMTEGT